MVYLINRLNFEEVFALRHFKHLATIENKKSWCKN